MKSSVSNCLKVPQPNVVISHVTVWLSSPTQAHNSNVVATYSFIGTFSNRPHCTCVFGIPHSNTKTYQPFLAGGQTFCTVVFLISCFHEVRVRSITCDTITGVVYTLNTECCGRFDLVINSLIKYTCCMFVTYPPPVYPLLVSNGFIELYFCYSFITHKYFSRYMLFYSSILHAQFL